MRHMIYSFRRQTARVTALLAAILLAGSFLPDHAFARLSTCRTDPIITLTNLQTMDIGTTINDSSSDVKAVLYLVHVPRGTGSLLSISYSIGFSGREAFIVYADNPANVYDTYTTVYTYQPNVPVQAYTSVSLLPLLGTHYVNGYSGHTVHIHMSAFL